MENRRESAGEGLLLKAANRLSVSGLEKVGIQFALTKPDFYVNMADVVRGSLVGETPQSSVYLGRYFGDIVAVKVKRAKNGEEDQVLRELALLQHFNHPNIMSFVGASDVARGMWEDLKGCVFVISEFATNGRLNGLLMRDVELGWKLRVRMARDAARAIACLHSNHFIHRDIKAENFLVDEECNIKISNFSLARQLEDGEEKRRLSIVGSAGHMAPEVLGHGEYNMQADVFSFGVCLVEIMTRQCAPHNAAHPLLSRDPDSHEIAIDEVRESCTRAGAPASLVELAAQCCDGDPDMRPPAPDVLDWLTDLLGEMDDDAVPPPDVPALPEVGALQGNLNSTDQEAHHLPLESPRLSPRSPNKGAGNEDVVSARRKLPTKRGWLFKRDPNGLKLWRKRWFVLDPLAGTLTRFTSKEDEDKNHPRGVLHLANSVLLQSDKLRFQILRQEDVGLLDGGKLPRFLADRELGAANAEVGHEWIYALQRVIDLWDNEFEAHGDEETPAQCKFGFGVASAPHPKDIASSFSKKKLTFEESEQIKIYMQHVASHPMHSTTHVSVASWLASLSLSHLLPKFEAAQYTSIAQLRAVGLNNDDLDAIGVQDSKERQLLLMMCKGVFAPHLSVRILSHHEVGTVVLYRVLSRLQTRVSSKLMRYTDFAELHGALKYASRRPGRDRKTAFAVPHLPGKGMLLQNQRSLEFKNKRLGELQAYMDGVVASAGGLGPGSDEFDVLVQHLGLASLQ